MSFLSQVKKPKPQAPIITLVGFPGTGKTSMAGLFPDPIFITAENSQTVFESWPEERQPSFMPQLPHANKAKGIKPSEVLKAQLRELVTEKHPFKTVIIDTATSLNDLFEEEVVEYDSNPEVQDIGNAAGGYHKGFDVVAGMHAKVIMMAECLRQRGMAVVFLAHVGIRKHKNQPDIASEYNTFSLGMHQKSSALYVKNSDACLYLKINQFVMGQESDRKGRQTKAGRVTTSGDRVLICSSDGVMGYVDAKQRYEMPEEIDVPKGSNPILDYIPFFKTDQSRPEKPEVMTETETETN